MIIHPTHVQMSGSVIVAVFQSPVALVLLAGVIIFGLMFPLMEGALGIHPLRWSVIYAKFISKVVTALLHPPSWHWSQVTCARLAAVRVSNYVVLDHCTVPHCVIRQTSSRENSPYNGMRQKDVSRVGSSAIRSSGLALSRIRTGRGNSRRCTCSRVWSSTLPYVYS